MKDNELFELCKEVYERTEWEDTLQFFDGFLGDGSADVETEGGWESEGSSYSFDKRHNMPLYTSDYLLEKLPNRTRIKKFKQGYKAQWTKDFRSGHTATGKNYTTHKLDLTEESDTPLKALLKLTISLHEAGEL